MTETQKRIKAYKKALPHMKERVTAVALLLVIAVTMMTSATFAWMTLSRSPEVSSIYTTVTTNGNLEIALSGPDGRMPAESAVGDGRGDITQTNLTWGNLINLSDARYGLKDIVLRPASLNTKTLATNPMHAVQYGADGRVTGYLYDFLYANYVQDPNTGAMYFSPEDVIKYGVRAISTVTYEDVTGDAMMIRKIEQMQASLIEAKQNFQNIYDINNSADAKKYMSAVGGLVGVHVDYTLNGGAPDASKYIQDLYNLANEFLLCVVDMGEVIVEGANLCVFMSLEDRDEYDEKAFTFEDLINGTLNNAEIERRCVDANGNPKYDVNFTTIEDFRTLWKKLAGNDGRMQGVNEEWKPVDDNGVFVEQVTLPSYSTNYDSPVSKATAIYGAYEVILAKYQDYYNRQMTGAADQTVPWESWMLMAVNQMCDVEKATIRYEGGQDYTPAQLLALKSNAINNAGILMKFVGNGPFYATINDGAIQDVGQLLGKPLDVPSSNEIRIKATVNDVPLLGSMDIDMKPSISTSYDVNGNVLESDIEEAKRLASGGSDYRGDPVAAETYAMVVDFWIRTNAQNTLLTLEGELVYNQKTGTDATGRKLGLLFSYPGIDEETQEEVTRYVYQHQNRYFYDYENEGINDELVGAELEAVKDKLTAVYEDKPSGYEGVNRVWDEMNDPNNEYAQNVMQQNGMSTTQGSGSCYIFYPQSMEDHKQSLKLLASMRVAFVDANGTLLATAYMDTNNVVEDAGRVIVPLRLRNNDTPIVDANGETVYQYITPLMKNEAKRVSAIVYLEGENLKNSEVLAAGSITGQMNIQFGTTDVTLNAVNNNDVMKEYYTFDFSLDGNRNGSIEETEQNNEYEIPSNADRIVDLYLDLGEAATPELVEGNFVAVINATQGARQNTFTMIKSEQTGLWEAYHYVPNENPALPGTYVKGVPFSGPGNYQLRSIRIDGVDYLLDESQIVKVSIPGMSVSLLQWEDTLENSKNLRTADSQIQAGLKLRLESNDTNAHKVQGVFLGENGQNVTVNFYSEDKINYEGVATFSAGGQYKLTYVYVDEELVPIHETMYKQIELQLGLQVEIGYTAPRIMESELRIPDGLTEEEQEAYIAEILKDMVATPKSCYFRYNRLAPLEMEVWCKIYDDMDNELMGLDLPNPALFFGSAANGLDTDLVWNPTEERYEGTFLITKNGIYNFASLILDDGSTITKAVSSPTIQSASPDPVFYVHNMNQYPEVTYDLGLPASQRVLQFKLRNSQGASIKVALNNTPITGVAAIDETENPEYLIIDNMSDQYASWWTESQPDNNGVVTYTLTLPRDGYWEIVGLYLGGGAYYNNQLWSGETDADWADLSELVQADNIRTYYLTEVKVTATGLPDVSTTLNFMQSNDSSITIKVENQNRPLAEVLAEVATLFPKAGIDPSVEIDLYYTYTSWNAQKWSVSDASKLPMTLTGGKMENGAFALNVKLTTEGNYEPHFTLKIGGEPYTGTIPERLKTGNLVTVRWNMPTVTVTDVTGAIKDAQGKVTGYNTFSFNLAADGYSSAYSGLDGVKNYYEDYYACVYIATDSGKNHTIPEVELTMSHMGNATKAYFTVANNGSSSKNAEYSFTADGALRKPIGGESGTSFLNWSSDRYHAGKQTISTIKMDHGGLVYEFTLNNSVIINQPSKPIYLTLTESLSEVNMPEVINYYNVNGKQFTLATNGKSSVNVISPDGREFSVELPTMNKVVDNRIVLSTTSATYDNEAGYAVGTYAYTQWTEQEKDGCDTVDVTYYQQYQQWQRQATVSGIKETYRDTYYVESWSGKAAGTRQTVSSTTTWTADAVKTTSELVGRETLSNTTETQIKYVKVGEKTKTKPAGTPVGNESELPMAFPG